MGSTSQIAVWYDPYCGVCSFWVGKLKKASQGKDIIFLPLEQLPIQTSVDSIIVKSNETYYYEAEAAIVLGIAVGGGYGFLARLAKLLPNKILSGLYKWVAKNRLRISKTCQLPAERLRSLTPEADTRTTPSVS